MSNPEPLEEPTRTYLSRRFREQPTKAALLTFFRECVGDQYQKHPEVKALARAASDEKET
jgi:hypothetical protein